MTLENEVLDSLEDLHYHKIDCIRNDVSLLTDMKTFSSIVSWISSQFQSIEKFESFVNPINEKIDDKELESFEIELKTFVRELDSPFIDFSIKSDTNKLSILNYICGELLSSRMNYANRKSGSNGSMSISMNESQTAKDLKTIILTLNLGKPPNNIRPKILFNKIKEKLIKRLTEEKMNIEESLLLPEGLNLSSDQWNALQTVNDEFYKDYTLRREMLLRRCDCTIKSFSWKSDSNSDNSKTVGEKEINEIYGKERQLLNNKPNVSLADALAARESDLDDLINGVISNRHTNCVIQMPETQVKANKGIQQRLELHKYIIGSVPDRGGRPHEQPAPQMETFNQQKFQRDNPQRGRGRGRGGPQGSGGQVKYQEPNQQRIQGSGWAHDSGNRYSNNPVFDNELHSQSRGGYRDQQNQNNYQSGHQRYSGRDEQLNTGFQHQKQFNAYHPQQYDERQLYNNYSDQSFYGNTSRQQYQQQSDSNQYNEQRDRNYNRGAYRRGFGGRR